MSYASPTADGADIGSRVAAQPPRRPRRAAVVAISLVLIATGCAQTAGGIRVDAEGFPTVPRDAGIAQIAAAFSACSEPLGDIAPAVEYLEEAVGWMQVEAIVQASDNPGRTQPATVVVDSSGGGGSTLEAVSIHGSYWPGIEWALDTGGDVWFAIGDPGIYAGTNAVLYVLAFTADGHAFFPGSCQHRILYEPLQQQLGTTFEERMDAIPGNIGPDLVKVLRGETP